MQSVLIVDDNEQNLYFLEVLLKGHGFEATMATNGADALKLALESPPELVISDILMPVMDGYALCLEWMANEKLKKIPFIFYTATFTDQKDEELGLNLGASKYVIKPQQPEILIRIINDVLEADTADSTQDSAHSVQNEQNILREYNEALFRKLEKKMTDLEKTNRELENTISEQKRLEGQLRHKQKLESIGQLAGGVAHDFNNLLTPIIGYADLLKRDLSNNSAGQAKANNILSAAHRAKELVKQLMSFSRKQIMDIKTVDLSQVITEFQSILRHTIRESIDIRFCLSEERYCIRADRNQIEQVIMNLAVNAQDAIVNHGVITIETAPVLLDDEYALQYPEISPGQYLMLAISDNGCGMDHETRQRIFEPFFTTKGIGKGTGLGLATAYGIVQQHGGTIWVYSEPDKGTTFKCYFPLADETPLGEQFAVHEQVSLSDGRGTILLVEDNEMVRNFVHELLTSQGFEVLAAEEPLQALEVSGNRSLDLLISDIIMPNMTGPELHAMLLENHPRLQVLYMSGYTGNVISHQCLLEEGVHFIQKPFAITEFARKVKSLLLL